MPPWEPSPSVLAEVSAFVDASLGMTGATSTRVTEALNTLSQQHIDFPNYLLFVLTNNGRHQQMAGALLRGMLRDAVARFQRENRPDLMQNVLETLPACLPVLPPSLQSILASCIATVATHRQVLAIWPELKQAVVAGLAGLNSVCTHLRSIVDAAAQNSEILLGDDLMAGLRCGGSLMSCVCAIAEDSITILEESGFVPDIAASVSQILHIYSSMLQKHNSTGSSSDVLAVLRSGLVFLRLVLYGTVPDLKQSFPSILESLFPAIAGQCYYEGMAVPGASTALATAADIQSILFSLVAVSLHSFPELYTASPTTLASVIALLKSLSLRLLCLAYPSPSGGIAYTQTHAPLASLSPGTPVFPACEDCGVLRDFCDIWFELLTGSAFEPYILSELTPDLVQCILNGCVLTETELSFLLCSVGGPTDTDADGGEGSVSDESSFTLDPSGPWTARKICLHMVDTLAFSRPDILDFIVRSAYARICSGNSHLLESGVTILASITPRNADVDQLMPIIADLRTRVLDFSFGRLPDLFIPAPTPELARHGTQRFLLQGVPVVISADFLSGLSLGRDVRSQPLVGGAGAPGPRTIAEIIVSHTVFLFSRYCGLFAEGEVIRGLNLFVKMLVYASDARIRFYAIGGLGDIVDGIDLSGILLTGLIRVVSVLLASGGAPLGRSSTRAQFYDTQYLFDLLGSCARNALLSEETALILLALYAQYIPPFMRDVVEALTVPGDRSTADERAILLFMGVLESLQRCVPQMALGLPAVADFFLRSGFLRELLQAFVQCFILIAENVDNCECWPDTRLAECILNLLDELVSANDEPTLDYILGALNGALVPILVQNVNILHGGDLQSAVLGTLGNISERAPRRLLNAELLASLLSDMDLILRSRHDREACTNGTWLFGMLVESLALYGDEELWTRVGLSPALLACASADDRAGEYDYSLAAFLDVVMENVLDGTVHKHIVVNSAAAVSKWANACAVLVDRGALSPNALAASRVLLLLAENADSVAIELSGMQKGAERDNCYAGICKAVLAHPDLARECADELVASIQKCMETGGISSAALQRDLATIVGARLIPGLETVRGLCGNP